MSNIKNYYFNNLDIKLTNSDYWDLFLCYDERLSDNIFNCNSIISGTSLVSYFDFNNPNCLSGNSIHSLSCWNSAKLPISGLSLCDIGLTGVDNGFVNNLTGETLTIGSGDCRLFLTRVSGQTYDYSWSVLSGQTGNYINLCGGFFQGFWKLQDFDYQVLPKRMHLGWTAEFWVYKTNDCLSGNTNTTLNDLYPNNKGFFFYLGARAENKFWNLFSGETGYTTCNDTMTITPTPRIVDPVDVNSFLYNECGCGTLNCEHKPITGNTDCCFNPYDIYNTCGDPCGGCGSTGCNGDCNESKINGFIVNSSTTKNYSCSAVTVYNKDPEADIIDNNLGFRIKDDGSIGYRKIVYTANCRDCCVAITGTAVSGISIVEQYSISGMVKDNKWEHIAIVFQRYCEYDDCVESEKYPPFPDCKKGKLKIFVNGYLKLCINDFDEVLFRNLDEVKYKVEGVPYNISIGGGTQGLIESRTFNGPDPEDKNLLLEQYFAGSFVGGISKFRLYEVPLDITEIRCNYNSEKDIYN